MITRCVTGIFGRSRATLSVEHIARWLWKKCTISYSVSSAKRTRPVRVGLIANSCSVRKESVTMNLIIKVSKLFNLNKL